MRTGATPWTSMICKRRRVTRDSGRTGAPSFATFCSRVNWRAVGAARALPRTVCILDSWRHASAMAAAACCRASCAWRRPLRLRPKRAPRPLSISPPPRMRRGTTANTIISVVPRHRQPPHRTMLRRRDFGHCRRRLPVCKRKEEQQRRARMIKSLFSAAGAVMALQCAAIAQEAPMSPLRPDQIAFRALYTELVETNTTLSAGSCTLAAERIAAHLKAAGFADKDVTLFSAPDHPKEGGLVAILAGGSKTAKPMLLLGHLDVVEAKREDWTRDPFALIEENGYFYGRGAADMKAMDATWVDALMRFKKDGYRPKRTIKLALTCGEETTNAFNGAQWLAKNKPELISAAFALNEGGGGRTDGHGKLVVESIQVGEKAAQNYRLETV